MATKNLSFSCSENFSKIKDAAAGASHKFERGNLRASFRNGKIVQFSVCFHSSNPFWVRDTRAKLLAA